jgi:uncharacterized protein (TIGR02246 family)
MSADLEARVAALEAERAIRRLVGSYARACDPIDPDRIASLFTEDGTWSSRTTDGSVEFGAASGREAIRATFAGLGEAIASPTAHYNLQEEIDVAPDGRSAAATWYTIVLTRGRTDERPEGDPTLLLGTYEHEYRRGEDGWRFTRVDTLIDFMASVAGLPGQLPARERAEA